MSSSLDPSHELTVLREVSSSPAQLLSPHALHETTNSFAIETTSSTTTGTFTPFTSTSHSTSTSAFASTLPNQSLALSTASSTSSTSSFSSSVKAKVSKYDFVKVRVWVGGPIGDKAAHYHVLSRYLVARLLAVTKLPTRDSIRLSLDLKKRLVDTGRLDVTSIELENELFELLKQKIESCKLQYFFNSFRKINWFHHSYSPLLILIYGNGCIGKSTIATRLANQLNLTHTLQSDLTLQILQARDTTVDSTPLYLKSFASCQAFQQEYQQRCRRVRQALEYDLIKLKQEGRSLIIEGMEVNPLLFLKDLKHIWKKDIMKFNSTQQQQQQQQQQQHNHLNAQEQSQLTEKQNNEHSQQTQETRDEMHHASSQQDQQNTNQQGVVNMTRTGDQHQHEEEKAKKGQEAAEEEDEEEEEEVHTNPTILCFHVKLNPTQHSILLHNKLVLEPPTTDISMSDIAQNLRWLDETLSKMHQETKEEITTLNQSLAGQIPSLITTHSTLSSSQDTMATTTATTATATTTALPSYPHHSSLVPLPSVVPLNDPTTALQIMHSTVLENIKLGQSDVQIIDGHA